MTTASQLSVDMVRHLASIICLLGDRDKLDLPLSESNEQALTHCSQTMMWIASQGKANEIQKRLKEELETEQKNRVRAEKASNDLRQKCNNLTEKTSSCQKI